MSMFRRSARVPGAREAGPRRAAHRQGGDLAPVAVADLPDLADLTDPEAVDGVLQELDELRATVYRQANHIRDDEARIAAACATARAEEHHRIHVTVATMRALAAADGAAPPEVAAFAARVEAAVARLLPVSAAPN